LPGLAGRGTPKTVHFIGLFTMAWRLLIIEP